MSKRMASPRLVTGVAVTTTLFLGGVWVSLAVPDGGPQTLDAYTLTVQGFDVGGQRAQVPTSELAARCGDGDACSVRLSLSEGTGSVLAWTSAARFFSTNESGDSWRGSTLEGFVTGSGTTTDGTEVFILTLDDGAGRNCTFLDDPATGDYRIQALNSMANDPADCTIRIDD